jgi:hypothetical protein
MGKRVHYQVDGELLGSSLARLGLALTTDSGDKENNLLQARVGNMCMNKRDADDPENKTGGENSAPPSRSESATEMLTVIHEVTRRKNMKIRLILVLVVLGLWASSPLASALDDDSPETPSETCCCNGETMAAPAIVMIAMQCIRTGRLRL